MVKWYVSMFVGMLSCTIGYYIGRGHARTILKQAEVLLEEIGAILSEAEKINKQTEDMLDE